jgi:nucleoside-diphosphate-sugar epimerase
MRVCVTGGTGFVGGALVERLLAEGKQVRALARVSARADALEQRGAEVVRGDLSDAAALERAVADAEVVYHAAAKVDPPGTKAEYFTANVEGTVRVLAASLQQKVQRVVYLSSVAVYGIVRAGEAITEDTPFDEARERRDFYAQSKIAADEAAMAFARRTGLPVTILRPGVVYGPPNVPGKGTLPVALLGFRAGKLDIVFGDGDNRFPLNYVENLVDAMLLAGAAARGASEGEPLRQYIVVDDEELTLAQYHAVKREVAKTRPIFLPGWPVLLAATFAGDALPREQVRRALQNRIYSTRRIREELGWAPRTTLREAIEEALRSRR